MKNLNNEILKEELTPEQWERFQCVLKERGIDDALLELPDIGDTVEFFNGVNSRIKQLRQENGLTQCDLANMLGVSQREYWRYEQEGYSVNIMTLAQIAVFYNVSLDWISGYFPQRKLFFEIKHPTMVNGYVLQEI